MALHNIDKDGQETRFTLSANSFRKNDCGKKENDYRFGRLIVL